MNLHLSLSVTFLSLVFFEPASAGLRNPIAGADLIMSARFEPAHFAGRTPGPDAPAPTPRTATRTALASIGGAEPILPAQFVSPRQAPAATKASNDASIPQSAWQDARQDGWHIPLTDRALSVSEKTAPLTDELIDAVARIEPMYDPTRLDAAHAEAPLKVSPGTARMSNVFGEHWHRADLDPNVNAKVDAIALAWHQTAPVACENYDKSRAHGFGEPALTGMSDADCRGLISEADRGSDRPAPVVVASISVPVFAAPLPGSRMSSRDFWEHRRQMVAEVQEKLRQKWQSRSPAFESAALDQRQSNP